MNDALYMLPGRVLLLQRSSMFAVACAPAGTRARPKIPDLVPPPLQSHTKLDGASSQAVSVRRANALFAHQKRELQW